MLHPGLYEQVINATLVRELSTISENRKGIQSIDTAEASKILAQYLTEIIQKGLDVVSEENHAEGLQAQVRLVNHVIDIVQKATHEKSFEAYNVNQPAQQLLALLGEHDQHLQLEQSVEKMVRPETSLSQSSLFTGGSVHEPQMMDELKKEIVSADRVDMLVSFIKWSGLRCVIEELKTFTQRGGALRIITTSYMGATEIKAIEELRQLPHTQIKVSYDTARTRLHAKTYIFHRNTGFSTAYVGSSNLTNAAISSGLEWNLKITRKDLPETIQKIDATFESYWNSSEFELYSEEQLERLKQALTKEKNFGGRMDEIYLVDVRPYPYQQEILDRLRTEREVHGKMHNLVVAATGTGKTIISALDFKRFVEQQSKAGKSHRLLFVAHREEILRQSLYTFRQVLKDRNFGELFVGNERPSSIENLFVSIQTFNSRNFVQITKSTDYDFIIVDEFHHAAASSYKALLSFYTPTILLGLTATPERMDGQNILSFFDNRIAAEIRLPEAIDRKLLCPFHYFGVTDTVNLDSVLWRSGGYEKKSLSALYATPGRIAEERADHIIRSILKYVSDIALVKGLGFCVTVEHARFMSRFFNARNIPSIALTGDSPDDERKNAKRALVSGSVRFIFVVDIYNEGVDIPEVNTVLFLRPTESLTIFLQQLGRGLRLAENKDCLTVLDFIGQANKKYNFEDKFLALQSDTSRSVNSLVTNGFTTVPKGCFLTLEKQAAKYVLENIKDRKSVV